MIRIHREKKNSLFISNTDWDNQTSTCRRMKLFSYFTPDTKFKPWKDSNVRNKIGTLLEETVEGKFHDVAQDFSDRIIKA